MFWESKNSDFGQEAAFAGWITCLGDYSALVEVCYLGFAHFIIDLYIHSFINSTFQLRSSNIFIILNTSCLLNKGILILHKPCTVSWVIVKSTRFLFLFQINNIFFIILYNSLKDGMTIRTTVDGRLLTNKQDWKHHLLGRSNRGQSTRQQQLVNNIFTINTHFQWACSLTF